MEVKELIDKKGKFTQAEKEYLTELGRQYDIEPPKEGSCGNCWRDMAIHIAVAMKPKPNTSRRLRGDAARDGVVFKGRLITNATLDEETLRWMDENDFPQTLLENAED